MKRLHTFTGQPNKIFKRTSTRKILTCSLAEFPLSVLVQKGFKRRLFRPTKTFHAQPVEMQLTD